MMIHLVVKRNAEDENGRLRTWCGRWVRHSQATTAVTATACRKCREAFARELRQLPDVFESKR